MAQFPSINAWLVVRSHGAPGTVADAVQAAVARVDRDLVVSRTIAAVSALVMAVASAAAAVPARVDSITTLRR